MTDLRLVSHAGCCDLHDQAAARIAAHVRCTVLTALGFAPCFALIQPPNATSRTTLTSLGFAPCFALIQPPNATSRTTLTHTLIVKRDSVVMLAIWRLMEQRFALQR